jgi:peptide/nickel transport system permease protein
VIQAIISILVIVSVVFFLSRLTGDPTHLLLGIEASAEDYDRVRANLGLDRSLIVQYGIFMKDILHGDFGRSLYLKKPVMEVIGTRFINTLELGVLAFAWSVALGIPLGLYAAVKRHWAFRSGCTLR